MDTLNEKEITAYAFKEAISREKHLSSKLKFYYQLSRSSDFKRLYAGLLDSSQSRIRILQDAMKNLHIS